MEPLSSNAPPLTIKVSVESIFVEPNGKLNQNSMLLLQCLTLLNTLSTTAPEGLKEASEALEGMVEFYKERADDAQQSSFPQHLDVIKGNILPSQVRPPLILDLE
ncbi:MAG: hypothetical protein KME29_17730 [Calothrix sp. FI2-JRJ7]|jgi:hypothetical protein|nr:hypothetical protein [Calothrix sp. FI2-JRJ7]